MYIHVFELLIRLKGNYMWPVMWSGIFSDNGPILANAELADELGVVMGTSHYEPCCRAGEEYKNLLGKDFIYGDAWNFRTNEQSITKFWEDGLKRSGKFDNVIIVGMRGEADTAIAGDDTFAENIQLLRDVLTTQNRLIKEYINEDIIIEAEHFISQKNGTNSSCKVIEGYGKTLSEIKSYPVINVYDDINEASYVEYDFILNEGGKWSFDFYQNLSNPAFMNNKLQFVVEVNGKIIIHDVVDSKTFAVRDTKQLWNNDVTNEIRISTVNFECKMGLNTFKFYLVTPNIVLEKIIIRPENYKLPESYSWST
ncbi:hypothetical protein LY90DRAFT_499706 [Neocallimastix californiae]|uniref:Uncharacterized protein n=1 Tax=Neocallimastix californiae TaxID=1754190 RepID=A0A1Y2FFQ6_9FUNG|nr:hypothetical protein LY90DRAFT_499706 [Neocallimastix californiae]|eukprot:ORY82742.1 hypothetical protein LY90DRAFT_499706 [Neocallimastix californiae]